MLCCLVTGHNQHALAKKLSTGQSKSHLALKGEYEALKTPSIQQDLQHILCLNLPSCMPETSVL